MNIAILSDGVFPFSMGGSHRVIFELGMQLAEKGHSVWCLVPELDRTVAIATLEERHIPGRFRIIRFPINRRNILTKILSYAFGYGKAFRKLAKEQALDVVNIHYVPALLSFLLSGRSRKKILYTFHGPWAAESRLGFDGKMESRFPSFHPVMKGAFGPLWYLAHFLVEKACLGKCAGFSVLSQYMKGVLVRTYGLGQGLDTAVIPGGINLDDFHPVKESWIRRDPAFAGKKVLLTIRRLDKRMGLDLLVEACSLLKKNMDGFVLLIAGKGVYRAPLERLIERLGCSSHVKLLGYIPESSLCELYGGADLFILPSRDLEGFGLVVLEAMACGVRVLTSPIGGPREVIERFDPELVLPGLQPEQISQRILELDAHGKIGRTRIEETVGFVRGNFSWEKYCDGYLEWIGKSGLEAKILESAFGDLHSAEKT